jgi:hypothetical protein
MVMVDIKPEEIKALDVELYDKATCSIQNGLVLGLLRVKIQEAINAELKKMQRAKAKEILDVKKKD